MCFSNGSDHLPIFYLEKLTIHFHNFLSNQLNGEKVDTPIEKSKGEKKFNLISNPSVIDLTKGNDKPVAARAKPLTTCQSTSIIRLMNSGNRKSADNLTLYMLMHITLLSLVAPMLF